MISNECVKEARQLRFLAQDFLKKGNRIEAGALEARRSELLQLGLSSDELRAKYTEALLEETGVNRKKRDVQASKEYRRAFHRMILGDDSELRDLLAGSQSITYTQGAAGGYLVPVETEKEIFEAIANFDPLLSDSVCDFEVSPGPFLQPTVLTGWDLSTVKSENISEAGTQGGQNIPTVAGRTLRSNNIHRFSIIASFEAEQDIPDWLGKYTRAAGVAFGRGLGKECMTGNGVTQAAGLFPSLGPAKWTTGTGKIVLNDINQTYFALDRAYRSMPKAAWLMPDGVYQRIRAATDNSGRPLLNVERDGETLLGKPVHVCPSLATGTFNSLGFGALIFGDLSHFKIRVSKPQMRRSLQQGVADVTRGEAAYITIVRADSAIFDPSGGSAPPIIWTEVIN